ncbi:gp31.2 hypothetical protein [Escherichia phage vB_EcoM_VR7]|uniref:Uncharacterized protein 31.2 n=1 Tax=Escherichia phage vB_EcoM_VR7 TaxID=700939 RepID=E5FIZ2_9CAUD|nr:hypothetical protein VR7_gp228 [Escherichia phage vB_EcoM_VR7]ADR32603.1 gp31.2 hypothetical protein [Escherichia phage vB_EcoM_VR7]
MKFRMVKISGLSSRGTGIIAFSVEYKKNFFSRWKSYYKSEWIDESIRYKTDPVFEKCKNLLSALKSRGTTTIKTVLE